MFTSNENGPGDQVKPGLTTRENSRKLVITTADVSDVIVEDDALLHGHLGQSMREECIKCHSVCVDICKRNTRTVQLDITDTEDIGEH